MMKNLTKIFIFAFLLISVALFTACGDDHNSHQYTAAYNYDSKTYTLTCAICDDTKTENAGSANYPYWARSEEELFSVVQGAQTNSFIKLANDIIVTSSDYNVVYRLPDCGSLDLGGHTVSVTKAPGGFVVEGSDVTIKNGTINLVNGGDYSLFVGDEGDNNDVLVKDITFNAGINVFNSKATLINCNVDASNCKYYAVWGDENARVFVESGSYRGGETACVHSCTTESIMTLNGGTFYGKIFATNKTVINSGEFDSDIVLTVYKNIMPVLVVNKNYNKQLNITCNSQYQITQSLDAEQNKVYELQNP